MSLVSCRSTVRFPWFAYAYSKFLLTCSVNGSTGPKPGKVWSLKRCRPNWYWAVAAAPGVLKPGGHNGFIVAAVQTVP